MFEWFKALSIFTEQYKMLPSNATQSHSGNHLVAKRLYAILKYVIKKKIL